MSIFPLSIGSHWFNSIDEVESTLNALDYQENVQHERLENDEAVLRDELQAIINRCSNEGCIQPEYK